ncbi:MAG TPA: hypothetical protein VK966_06935 [Longimicrobiales bacterium]|nr:hypothetical protein [Longimicrobiales bacterium]
MRVKISARALLLAMMVALVPLTVEGQAAPQEEEDPPSLEVMAARAAIGFRRYWMGDDTSWEACALVEELGEIEPFLATLSDPLRAMLVRSEVSENCPAMEGIPAYARDRRLVQLQRIEVVGATAVVRLFVQVGSHTHLEYFHLIQYQNRKWRVSDVIIRPGSVI